LSKRGRPSNKRNPETIGGKVAAIREGLGLSAGDVQKHLTFDNNGNEKVLITDGSISNSEQELPKHKFSDVTLVIMSHALGSDFGQTWLREYNERFGVAAVRDIGLETLNKLRSLPLPVKDFIIASIENAWRQRNGDSGATPTPPGSKGGSPPKTSEVYEPGTAEDVSETNQKFT
jgi:hypothetical protein